MLKFFLVSLQSTLRSVSDDADADVEVQVLWYHLQETNFSPLYIFFASLSKICWLHPHWSDSEPSVLMHCLFPNCSLDCCNFVKRLKVGFQYYMGPFKSLHLNVGAFVNVCKVTFCLELCWAFCFCPAFPLSEF